METRFKTITLSLLTLRQERSNKNEYHSLLRSKQGKQKEYENSAILLGEWIAKNNHTLVFGGGNAGLMGTIANTVIHNNGKTIGVMPTFLQQRELAHDKLDELIIVESMSERKEVILEKGDVCIALPGGPGTLEEITEVVSWSRVGQNKNPCIFSTQIIIILLSNNSTIKWFQTSF